MNQYMNEDLAWLHLQDLQRESENRRLLAAAARPFSAVAALRRLFDRSVAAVRPHEARVEEPADESGHSRRESVA
jgi:hypothetical protein